MRRCVLPAVLTGVLAVCASSCSQPEKQQTREELRRSGEAVKKELKNDAAFVKQEALKAREETQKGVRKLKEDVRSRDASDARAHRRTDTAPADGTDPNSNP